MPKRLIGILLSAVISIGALGSGAYWLGNTAYQDGVKAGITAVVEQCAKDHTTIYNGDTGDVMVCDGGHMDKPSETPSKALPEPPSGIAGEPEHGSIPQHMEDQQKVEQI